MPDLVLRSRIAHFLDEPSSDGSNVEYLEDGVLCIKDGKVVLCSDAGKAAREGFDLRRCEHLARQLIVPGFIDTHVHSTQIDVIASYGAQLLDWLENYTFPAEAKYRDEAHAVKAAEDFLDYCLAVGTTTTFAFTTSYRQSTEALFQAAFDRQMRLVAGKVLMDQNALPALQDTPASGYADSVQLIRNWHGRGRLGYAVTPRFSGTSSVEQLRQTGRLLQEHPDVWLQTHLSENLAEVDWLKSVHPDARDYLDTYQQYGLVTDRSIFAHCIHLSEDEVTRLADEGGRVAFCPTSNLFLGSGLMPIEQLRSAGIPVTIATDVGGGISLSMLTTLGEAYKVCQMQGYSLHPYAAFYMATLGNARAVHLDQYIGNFEPGKEADFIVLDPEATPIIKRRLCQTRSLEEELFVHMIMGDDRSVERTYCHGVELYNKNKNKNDNIKKKK
jgi:guanine deaminase